MNMQTATPIECYIPASVLVIEKVSWLLFYNDGTFQAYQEMPNGLHFEGKIYGKMGWNSDTRSVSYKETSLAIPA